MSAIQPHQIKYPQIIDGGLSNVLESLGCDLNHELWVAHLLTCNPEAIIKAHKAYLDAGAHIISTSSYQATIPGFMRLGYSKKEAEGLILKSVELAEIAINSFIKNNHPRQRPLIAGSIGPYGAYLADGSEYLGNYNITDQELIDFHKLRIDLLDNSNCDLLAFETIPSYQEAKILADITRNCKKPSWISFSCKNGEQINDGTPITEAAILFKNHTTIFAIGVNCTAPKYISNLIQQIKANCGNKKILVYPNSGEVYDAQTKTWNGNSDPKIFFSMSKEWLRLGADIIGGCCRIGPKHIQSLKFLISN